jgi:hypothetical protein
VSHLLAALHLLVAHLEVQLELGEPFWAGRRDLLPFPVQASSVRARRWQSQTWPVVLDFPRLPSLSFQMSLLECSTHDLEQIPTLPLNRRFPQSFVGLADHVLLPQQPQHQ